LQTNQAPDPVLIHEDERRAETLVDVVAAVLVLVDPRGGLAAHYERRFPVGADLYLVQPERPVPEAPGLVAGDPLLFGRGCYELWLGNGSMWPWLLEKRTQTMCQTKSGRS
jgi:hypothetical protein